jgi:hypothetical protein
LYNNSFDTKRFLSVPPSTILLTLMGFILKLYSLIIMKIIINVSTIKLWNCQFSFENFNSIEKNNFLKAQKF